jgi:hypothetical protein
MATPMTTTTEQMIEEAAGSIHSYYGNLGQDCTQTWTKAKLRALVVETARRCIDITEGWDRPGTRLTWYQIRERIRVRVLEGREGE